MCLLLYVLQGHETFFLCSLVSYLSSGCENHFLGNMYMIDYSGRSNCPIKYDEHTVLARVIFIAFLSQMIASKSSNTFLLNLSLEYGLLRFNCWEIYGNLSIS